MQVIIPCAGKSSRFPDTRPKYLLTMPDGRLMLQHAADEYYGLFPITFVIVREHSERYGSEQVIRGIYGDSVSIVVLDDFTSGPAETIYEVVKEWTDTPFISQDCDGFFDYSIPTRPGFVACVKIEDYPNLRNAAAKSFALMQDDALIGIAEKRIVSHNVCVGVYSFPSSVIYCNYFARLRKEKSGELFLSQMIDSMIENGVKFNVVWANNYVDCGVYESYIEHQKKHLTIFCDLDGVVFYNQSQHLSANNYTTPPKIKTSAVKFLIEKQKNGATIVFTTSRPTRFAEYTETALDACGFVNYRILYDLPHAPRLLINDVSPSNPWPSATAINSPRDDDQFWESIK